MDSATAPDVFGEGERKVDRILRKELPPVELLKSMFDYNPETGMLIWRKHEQGLRNSHRFVGKDVGHKTTRGYWMVTILGKKYWCHRLIWKYHHGYDPHEIDHINQNKSDNRIENLRDVTRTENNKNIRRRPKSGTVGVYFSKQSSSWCAQITVDKKTRNLGTYNTKAEAIAARRGAEIAMDYYGDNHLRA